MKALQTRIRSIAITLVCLSFYLCGCGPSDEASRLKEKNAHLEGENQQLRRQLEEAQTYQKVVQENPDKREFDLIEKDFKQGQDQQAVLSKYNRFIEQYPTSPLTANAQKRINEFETRQENEKRRQQDQDEFDRTPAIELDELRAYPEKYIGETFRVQASIRLSAFRPDYFGKNHLFGSTFELSGKNCLIFVATDSKTERTLMTYLQGKPFGIGGKFKLKVSRDAELNMIYQILECRL